MTRTVTVFEWKRGEGAGPDVTYDKVEIHQGTFLEFGLNYEHFDEAIACFTSALIELKDGTVINVSADLIKFNDKSEQS